MSVAARLVGRPEPTTGQLAVIGAAALTTGAGVCALVLSSGHFENRATFAVFGPLVGWSFIATGLYAWRRRPDSHFGVLMTWLGFAWFSDR